MSDTDNLRIINDEADNKLEHYKDIAVPKYDGRYDNWSRTLLQDYTMLLDEVALLACRGEVVSQHALGERMVEIDEYKEQLR